MDGELKLSMRFFPFCIELSALFGVVVVATATDAEPGVDRVVVIIDDLSLAILYSNAISLLVVLDRLDPLLAGWCCCVEVDCFVFFLPLLCCNNND